MYRMYTVLSLILLVSEMLKVPRAKFEGRFLKKFDFATNICLAQDAFRKCPRTKESFKIHSSMRIFYFPHFFYEAILVSELHRLLRCIASYKQSLS